MTRSPFFSSVLAAALALGLLFPRAAWAKYVPPPLAPGKHCVTEVGWMAPYDLRKIDEESEIARLQTGFVIDVLLAKGDDPIDEVASETFQAWRPGDPAKNNGILLVIQPSFPRGERKARLQVGKGVEALMTASKANDLLRKTIGPILNNGDQVRTAVAQGVLEIAKIVGADESAALPADAAAGPAPSESVSAPGAAPTAAHPPAAPVEGLGSMLWIVLGGCLAAGLGFFAYRRFGGGAKEKPKS